jgi:hypothetical protein
MSRACRRAHGSLPCRARSTSMCGHATMRRWRFAASGAATVHAASGPPIDNGDFPRHARGMGGRYERSHRGMPPPIDPPKFPEEPCSSASCPPRSDWRRNRTACATPRSPRLRVRSKAFIQRMSAFAPVTWPAANPGNLPSKPHPKPFSTSRPGNPSQQAPRNPSQKPAPETSSPVETDRHTPAIRPGSQSTGPAPVARRTYLAHDSRCDRNVTGHAVASVRPGGQT